MSNLSEEIINRYLTGQCSEEELIEVNAWMKESEENARQALSYGRNLSFG